MSSLHSSASLSTQSKMVLINITTVTHQHDRFVSVIGKGDWLHGVGVLAGFKSIPLLP